MTETYDPTKSSFFFAPRTAADQISQGALDTRRKIAIAMAARRERGPIKTFGEGIYDAASTYADAMGMRQLDAQERQAAAYEADLSRKMFGANTPAPTAGTAAGIPAAATTTAPPASAEPTGITPSRFANVRYNNPGAQYPVTGENASTFGQQGYGIIGGGHQIARFPTPVHGAAANMDLLDRNYTGMSVGDAIGKWSGGGRRDVPGFNTDTVITREMMRDPAFAIPFMKGIAGGEAPGQYPMTGEQWAQAHNMFTGARGAMPPPMPSIDPRGRSAGVMPEQESDIQPAPTNMPLRQLADGAGTMPSLQQPSADLRSRERLPDTQVASADTGMVSDAAPLWLRSGTQTAPPLGPALPDPLAIQKAPETVQTGALPAPPAAAPGVQGPALGQGGAIEKAPAAGVLPAQEQIPPAAQPYLTEVRPEKPRPQPLPISPDENKWKAVLANPYVNPQGALAQRAQQQYEYEKNKRLELEKQAQEEWQHDRGLREGELKLREQRTFENPVRVIKDLNDRLVAQKAQLDIAKNPIEMQQLQANLDKTRVELSQAIQTYIKGQTQIEHVAGTVVQRPSTDPTARFEVAPGAPQMKEDVTELQGKARQFVARATPEIRLLENKQNGKAMTYFKDDILASRLPFGMDRKAVSDAYREQKDAFMNFGTAVMTHLSGASYGEKEMERTLSSYKPSFGDTDHDLALKAERRRALLESIGGLTNDAQGRDLIAKSNFNWEARRPVAQVPPNEIGNLSPGRKYIAPDRTMRQVPFEEIRTR